MLSFSHRTSKPEKERGKRLFPDSGSTCQSKIVPKKQKLIGFDS